MEEQTDGSVILTWKRQRKTFSSEDEAVRFIKNNRSRDDRVVRVQKDGYVEPLNRKRWRRRDSDL